MTTTLQPSSQSGSRGSSSLLIIGVFGSEDCQSIIDEAETRAGWRIAGAEARDSRVLTLNLRDSFFSSVADRIERKSIPAATQHWGLKGLRLEELSVVRYNRDAEVPLHTDTGPYKRHRVASIVCYLTDGFIGGDLVVPRLHFKGIAKLGEAILFPSAELHSATRLTSGDKTVLVGFLWEKTAAWI